MLNLFRELKRRKVYSAATYYMVSSWLILQVSDVLFPAFGLPDIAMRPLVLVLFFGLPVVVILTWALDITADGIELTPDPVPGERVVFRTRDYITIATLLVLMAVVALQQYVIYTRAGTNINPVMQLSDLSNSSGDMSIAVLPLANLSPNPDNAYFAAGIHEEILNQLVKIEAMKVTSRTAVLRYANSQRPIREIAGELNVGTIMTGSVRFSDNRVRIKTELVRAADDVYLWAESYEFQLDDIFAIQTDVALKVVSAMQTSLLPDEMENIRRPPTESTEAYALYLQYRYQLHQESGSSTLAEDGWIETGIRKLQKAVEIDPLFARGHAELGYVKWLKGQIKLEEKDQLYDAAVAQANQAIAIDPTITTAYETLARVAFDRLQWQEWKENAQISVELNDLDGRAAFSFAMALTNLGQYEEAYRWYEVAISKNPSIPFYWEAAITAYIWGGDYASALALTEQYLAVGGDENAYHVFRAYTQSRLGLVEESRLALAQVSDEPMLVVMWVTPGYLDYLRCESGETAAVLGELEQLKIDAARELRIQHCAAGANDTKALFDSFDRTIADGQIIYLTDVVTREVKADPRWQASAEYMGYPET
ncbi:MAG: hypothetical protein ABJK25_15135 [Halieaceae bacterium]